MLLLVEWGGGAGNIKNVGWYRKWTDRPIITKFYLKTCSSLLRFNHKLKNVSKKGFDKQKVFLKNNFRFSIATYISYLAVLPLVSRTLLAAALRLTMYSRLVLRVYVRDETGAKELSFVSSSRGQRVRKDCLKSYWRKHPDDLRRRFVAEQGLSSHQGLPGKGLEKTP